jgi:enamine deaminase RidA (YjgF/YER057c/UK114 family)
MNRRRSIDVPGLHHEHPIPAACRIGHLLVSGGISGKNAETGKLPPAIDEQCGQMFANIRRIMEAAGGSANDIIKVTVWLRDKGNRTHVNKEWLAMFPDPQSRPARHTFASQDLPDGYLVQCEIMAVLPE